VLNDDEDDFLCEGDDDFLSDERNDEFLTDDDEEFLADSRLKVLAEINGSNSVIEAWRFYEANRSDFSCKVYVPFLHVQLREGLPLEVMTNCLRVQDLGMFIFGCAQDQERMLASHEGISATIIDEAMIDGQDVQLPNRFRNIISDAPSQVKFYIKSVEDENSVGENFVDDINENMDLSALTEEESEILREFIEL